MVEGVEITTFAAEVTLTRQVTVITDLQVQPVVNFGYFIYQLTVCSA